ncbi:hypothetical protein CERZMDRAFT_101198 [Cercospora zeae-maydis SCOH1-5]|uniref:Uncharacterized protein n=1 Tax=Cercospora zeae-maydis SCOH1-5 TaxID=717836 RepID=A0A6A6F4B0_9PEZI|nr:hypothetical protein CERZMDRAFT_101198 [Cercospora zeae-maydis SCOH1-5]
MNDDDIKVRCNNSSGLRPCVCIATLHDGSNVYLGIAKVSSGRPDGIQYRPKIYYSDSRFSTGLTPAKRVDWHMDAEVAGYNDLCLSLNHWGTLLRCLGWNNKTEMLWYARNIDGSERNGFGEGEILGNDEVTEDDVEHDMSEHELGRGEGDSDEDEDPYAPPFVMGNAPPASDDYGAAEVEHYDDHDYGESEFDDQEGDGGYHIEGSTYQIDRTERCGTPSEDTSQVSGRRYDFPQAMEEDDGDRSQELEADVVGSDEEDAMRVDWTGVAYDDGPSDEDEEWRMAESQRQQKLAELEQRVAAIEKCISDMKAIPRASLGSTQQPRRRDVQGRQADEAASRSSSCATASSSRQATDDRVMVQNLRREVDRLKKVVASNSHSQRSESWRQADFEIVDGGNEAENGKADEPVSLPPPWPFRVMYTRRPNLADGPGQ